MNVFGNLIPSVLNKKSCSSIDYLFRNSDKLLSKMSVIEVERQIAYERLNKLTAKLQTKRLRYNAKSACDYFTL